MNDKFNWLNLPKGQIELIQGHIGLRFATDLKSRDGQSIHLGWYSFELDAKEISEFLEKTPRLEREKLRKAVLDAYQQEKLKEGG